MSVQIEKIPPVPQTTPPVIEAGPGVFRFDNAWMQWFVQLKIKIDTINANLVGIGNIDGVGFTGRDSNGVWFQRSMEGTTNRITVANGDGVSGNPQIDIAATYIGQPSITTVGTIDTGTWQGATIQATYGGTGISSYTPGNYIRAASATMLEQVTPAQVRDDIGAASTPPGYIDGLWLTYLGLKSFSVSSGTAYIEASASAVTLPATITMTGITTTINAWHHVYLYLNAGTPDIEYSTTAPAPPYNGLARSKTGDPTRRYIGSFRTVTASSGNIIPFLVDTSGFFRYMYNPGSIPTRVLSNGTSSVRVTIPLSTAVPITATAIEIAALNTDIVQIAFISNPLSAFGDLMNVPAVGVGGAAVTLTFSSDATQNINYAYDTVPAAGLYIDVRGFVVGR